MEDKYYKYLSLVLGIVVIALVVYIWTRPKPVDTLALNNDLAQFQSQLAAWNEQYGSSPDSTEAKSALSSDLSSFTQRLQQYQK